MTAAKPMYIAGVGMITSVGGNAEMTAAAINAGVSGYQASNYTAKNGKPFTMANVPETFFYELDLDLNRHNHFQLHHAHLIKLAVYALLDTYQNFTHRDKVTSPLPLLLAMPEPKIDIESIPNNILIENILDYCPLPFDDNKIHRLHTGRSSGIELLNLAHRYLHDLNEDFVVIGGTESYINTELLNVLENDGRLLYEQQHNAFAPGEAACFVVLTAKPELAFTKNNNVISIDAIGLGNEPGHLSSDLPYKGEGLSEAFSQALSLQADKSIDTVYCSLNGEAHWTKEQGVALMRHQQYTKDNFAIEHPADCIGDVGAATGPVLLALSALALMEEKSKRQHLIYSSSDGEKRAALLLSNHDTAELAQ